MTDSENLSINSIVEESNNFIDEKRQDKQNVLVHCQNGINESVVLISAYMIMKEQITSAKALKRLMEIRPNIRPSNCMYP